MGNFYLNKDMRLSNETFINRFIEKYGKDRFDFSKTNYTSMRSKITITCKIHGDFTGIPQFLLSNNKYCKDCKRQDALIKVNEKLRDLGSDFTLLEEGFINTRKPAKFICNKTNRTTIKVPGEFLNKLSKAQKHKEEKSEEKSKKLNFLKNEIESINNSLELVLNTRLNYKVTCKKHRYSKIFSSKKTEELCLDKNKINSFCKVCIKEENIIKGIEELKGSRNIEKIDLSNVKINFTNKENINNIRCTLHDITFNSSLYNLQYRGQRSCPDCSKELRYKKNFKLLKDVYPELLPELLSEWDYEKNDLDPNKCIFILNKRVYLICNRCKNNFSCTLRQKIKNRYCCPNCSLKNSSRIERLIFYFMDKVFKNIKNNEFYENLINKKNNFSYDIMISDLEPKLIIEYDGSFFHKEKMKFDKLKTKKIIKNGFNCLRIREFPLEKIKKDDIPYIYISMDNQLFEDNFKWLIGEIFKYIKRKYDNLDEGIKERMEMVLGMHLNIQSIPKDYFIYPFKEKSLGSQYPALTEIWDLESNKISTEQVSCKSNNSYYWKCNCGNSYEKGVQTQIKKINNDENFVCNDCLSFSKKITLLFNEKKLIKYVKDKFSIDLKENYNDYKLFNKKSIKLNLSCENCDKELIKSISFFKSKIQKNNKILCSYCTQQQEKKENL